jgi:hypothetical protein
MSVICGVFLICVRLFLYEKEHGKIQSKIEDMWNRLDEMHPRALARHLALMRTLAHGVTVSFDKVFGAGLFSLEAVVVTIWLSFSTILITLYFFMGIANQEWEHSVIWEATTYLALGSLPLLIRLTFRKGRNAARLRRKASTVWLIVSVIFYCWRFIGTQIETIYNSSNAASAFTLLILAYSSILIGVSGYFLSILVIRRTFRAIEKSTSFVKPVFLSFLNLTPALVVSLTAAFFWTVLEMWPFTEPFLRTNSPEELISLWASNRIFRIQASIALPAMFLILFELIFCFSAVLFFGLGLFLIAHRFSWPVILRLLYASKKNEIVSKGRVLLIVGGILIIIGLGRYEWLIKVLE